MRSVGTGWLRTGGSSHDACCMRNVIGRLLCLSPDPLGLLYTVCLGLISSRIVPTPGALRLRDGAIDGVLQSDFFFSLSPTPPPTLGSTRICGSSPCTMLAGPSVNQHPSRLTLRGAAARCRVYVRHAGASFVEEAFWACVDARLAFVMRPAETLGGPPTASYPAG